MSERDKTAEKAGEEPFLKRWSRLKTDDAGEAPLPATTEAGTESEPADADAAPAAIDPADLPDIETLDGDSDYTVFMQEGVPDDLRKMALRKLFVSNPAFSVLDGLNEYDEDYSLLGMVAEKVSTAYKVGRGFLEDEDLVELDEDEDEGEVEGEGQEIVEASPDDRGADGAAEPEGTGTGKRTDVEGSEHPSVDQASADTTAGKPDKA